MVWTELLLYFLLLGAPQPRGAGCHASATGWPSIPDRAAGPLCPRI